MDPFFNSSQQRLRAGWRLVIQLLLMFFLSGILTLLFRQLWQSSLSIASVLPQALGAAGSIWIAARLLDRRAVTDYGISFDYRWSKDFVVGSLMALMAVSIIFFIEWWLGWLRIVGYGWNTTPHFSFVGPFLSSLSAMLLVGFYEEWFSRGYQLLNLAEGLRYPSLGDRTAIAIATLTTSTLFGLLHFFNPNATVIAILNIVLAGIVLAIPYILTGRLGLSVGLHFSWNFTQGAIYDLPVSGTQLDTSLLHTAQKGPALWTGGPFGPEAGLLGLLGMAIMLGGTYVYIITSGDAHSTTKLFEKQRQLNTKSGEQAV